MWQFGKGLEDPFIIKCKAFATIDGTVDALVDDIEKSENEVF